MAKKITFYAERTSQSENEWAVSYGDIITLLLVFFIILLGNSGVSNVKLQAISQNISGGTTSIDDLEDRLKKIIKEKELENSIIIDKNLEGIDLIIQDKLLFASGEAVMSLQTARILVEFIREFEKIKKTYRFEIEGHTDDNPINSEKFPSNWYLSSYRALSILNIFLRGNFDPDRFLVQGLADTKPLRPNRDERGIAIPSNQAKNRRVVIKVR